MDGWMDGGRSMGFGSILVMKWLMSLRGLGLALQQTPNPQSRHS